MCMHKTMIFPVCLGILLVGIVMVPSAFAIFPDPEKDPRDYLVRYYTEPDYQAWFDKNYPNDTIEDKVGYSKKIVTDDYYVDQLFDFAMKYPSVNYLVQETARSLDEDMSGLVAFHFGGTDDWAGGYILFYNQRDVNDIYYDDLLYYYQEIPTSAAGEDEEGVSVQIKVNNKTWENDGIRDIIRFESSLSTFYNDNFYVEELRDTTHETKDVTVIILYPNGDEFSFIFDTRAETYSKDVKEFDKIVDSFYVGETEKLSDLLEDYAPELKSVAAEPSGGCGPGTVLVDGVCQLAPVESSGGCGQGTVLVDGVCQLAPQESNDGCGQGTVLVDGVCQLAKTGSPFNILSGSTIEPLYIVIGAVAVGGGIVGIVFAVRRGSGGTKRPKPARQDLDDYESQYLAGQGQRPSPKPAETRQTSSSCNNCGARLKPAAKFCGQCGSPRS